MTPQETNEVVASRLELETPYHPYTGELLDFCKDTKAASWALGRYMARWGDLSWFSWRFKDIIMCKMNINGRDIEDTFCRVVCHLIKSKRG